MGIRDSTYPLPEAQMDRFFLRVSMGYPTLEEEMAVLERFSGTVKPQASLTPVCSARDVIAMQDMVGTVYCSKMCIRDSHLPHAKRKAQRVIGQRIAAQA